LFEEGVKLRQQDAQDTKEAHILDL